MIEVRDLAKTYTSIRRGDKFRDVVKMLFAPEKIRTDALKAISFTIGKGEIVGLIGPNGAGKSTTLKILTGVLYPDSGSASVMGFVPWKERRRYVAHIGAVFGQKSQLIWDIPPLDSFSMNAAIYGIPNIEYRKRLSPLVEMLKVSDVIKKPTRNLSLGERMKCEFIMAMLHSPEILFLDEPTIGLDLIAKDRIRSFVKEINGKGTTIILTTHDMDDIENLAKRVIVINTGEIVFDDTLDALRSRLGTSKIVHVKTRHPLPVMDADGLCVTNIVSVYEAECEIDTMKINLAQFIERINTNSTIMDLSVGEQPIEKIVKEIYRQTGNEH
jgi:ABC-2 type transport system ATP-binding protein